MIRVFGNNYDTLWRVYLKMKNNCSCDKSSFFYSYEKTVEGQGFLRRKPRGWTFCSCFNLFFCYPLRMSLPVVCPLVVFFCTFVKQFKKNLHYDCEKSIFKCLLDCNDTDVPWFQETVSHFPESVRPGFKPLPLNITCFIFIYLILFLHHS